MDGKPQLEATAAEEEIALPPFDLPIVASTFWLGPAPATEP